MEFIVICQRDQLKEKIRKKEIHLESNLEAKRQKEGYGYQGITIKLEMDLDVLRLELTNVEAAL